MKIVINKCYGSFSLSSIAIKKFLEKKGKPSYFYTEDFSNKCYNRIDNPTEFYHVSTKDLGVKVDVISFESLVIDSYFNDRDIKRGDPDLISVVDELGEKANGYLAQLEIIEIPDNIDYEIVNYDGVESIHEKHRVWR